MPHVEKSLNKLTVQCQNLQILFSAVPPIPLTKGGWAGKGMIFLDVLACLGLEGKERWEGQTGTRPSIVWYADHNIWQKVNLVVNLVTR